MYGAMREKETKVEYERVVRLLEAAGFSELPSVSDLNLGRW